MTQLRVFLHGTRSCSILVFRNRYGMLLIERLHFRFVLGMGSPWKRTLRSYPLSSILSFLYRYVIEIPKDATFSTPMIRQLFDRYREEKLIRLDSIPFSIIDSEQESFQRAFRRSGYRQHECNRIAQSL